jgi:hypothetical protein
MDFSSGSEMSMDEQVEVVGGNVFKCKLCDARFEALKNIRVHLSRNIERERLRSTIMLKRNIKCWKKVD